jgi:hypothetical protein
MFTIFETIGNMISNAGSAVLSWFKPIKGSKGYKTKNEWKKENIKSSVGMFKSENFKKPQNNEDIKTNKQSDSEEDFTMSVAFGEDRNET